MLHDVVRSLVAVTRQRGPVKHLPSVQIAWFWPRAIKWHPHGTAMHTAVVLRRRKLGSALGAVAAFTSICNMYHRQEQCGRRTGLKHQQVDGLIPGPLPLTQALPHLTKLPGQIWTQVLLCFTNDMLRSTMQ